MSRVDFAGLQFDKLTIPNDKSIVVVFSMSPAYRDLGEMQFGCHAQFPDGSPYVLSADDFRTLEVATLSFLDKEYRATRTMRENTSSMVFDTGKDATYACRATRSMCDLSRPAIDGIIPVNADAPKVTDQQLALYEKIMGDIENQIVGTKIILPLHPYNAIVWREAHQARPVSELESIHFSVDITESKIRIRHHAHFMQSNIPFRDIWEYVNSAVQKRIMVDRVSGRTYSGSYSLTVRNYPSCTQFELYPTLPPSYEVAL